MITIDKNIKSLNRDEQCRLIDNYSIRECIKNYNYNYVLTGFSALSRYGYCADYDLGVLEVRLNLKSNVDWFICTWSNCMDEEYIKKDGFYLVTLNHALFDSIYSGIDTSRTDEAVEKMFYENKLNGFVIYAKKWNMPYETLKFALEPAIEKGFDLDNIYYNY